MVLRRRTSTASSRWLGLEDMYELYGSTEAAISTFRKQGRPSGHRWASIGDPAVQDPERTEDGSECPPAVRSEADGRIENYAEAVGEICRVAPDTALFQGYFENPGCRRGQKYREWGLPLRRPGPRPGSRGETRASSSSMAAPTTGSARTARTSAAAQVGRLVHGASRRGPGGRLRRHRAPVSDELVMVALEAAPRGARFDPGGLLRLLRSSRSPTVGMDRKWFPDFVRVVEGFEYTQTQKILVRHLKKDHFHRERLADAPLFWRQRGWTDYRPFRQTDFDALRADFDNAERGDLLDR